MTTTEPSPTETWEPFTSEHVHWYAPSEHVSPLMGSARPLWDDLHDTREVEASHRLVLLAEDALEGRRTRRRKAVARLISARAVEKQALNRLGFTNYGEYKVTTDGRRAHEISREHRAEVTEGPRPFT